MMFEAIKGRLDVLDRLLELGWTPTLNQICTDDWHVGLRHECVSREDLELRPHVDGDTVTLKADPHRYHIHSRKTTLVEAIDDAVQQVLSLTGQTYSELMTLEF